MSCGRQSWTSTHLLQGWRNDSAPVAGTLQVGRSDVPPATSRPSPLADASELKCVPAMTIPHDGADKPRTYCGQHHTPGCDARVQSTPGEPGVRRSDHRLPAVRSQRSAPGRPTRSGRPGRHTDRLARRRSRPPLGLRCRCPRRSARPPRLQSSQRPAERPQTRFSVPCSHHTAAGQRSTITHDGGYKLVFVDCSPWTSGLSTTVCPPPFREFDATVRDLR